MQSPQFRRTTPTSLHLLDEDEATGELDEPPEQEIGFSKRKGSTDESSVGETGNVASPNLRKPSLLTQALLSSPEMNAMSDADTPNLVSDGGMTSPARTTTPSPPLPLADYTQLPPLEPKALASPSAAQQTEVETRQHALGTDTAEETKIEQTLGRRRCISFACGNKVKNVSSQAQSPKPPPSSEQAHSPVAPTSKRPCMLRFACPMKPSHARPTSTAAHSDSTPNDKLNEHRQDRRDRADDVQPSLPVVPGSELPRSLSPSPGHIKPAIEISKGEHGNRSIDASSWSRDSTLFNRVDFQKSQATSFHEFATTFYPEDEWTNEQTAYRHKMTIDDTLQKEYAIRRLAEEAEEEAEEEELTMDHDNEDNPEDESDDCNTDGSTNDGNETDDEEGFGASEDDSDAGSEYHFWTPSLTTAATSVDRVEHVLPTGRVTLASESSFDADAVSGLAHDRKSSHEDGDKRACSLKESLLQPKGSNTKLEPFIIGTLDEDRPIQEALLSSLEQRRLSKQKLIPQDIDPSFPTSDPEAEDEGNVSDTEGSDDGAVPRPNQHLTRSESGTPDEEKIRIPRASIERRKMHSISPPKRLFSPPPRRLFGHSSHRLRCVPPSHKKINSPPSSRRVSPNARSPTGTVGLKGAPYLGQRPNLTHTASLPRFPNPFWDQNGKREAGHVATPSEEASPTTRHKSDDSHSRGPIDIVQGLENKRQRRREKFWRIHCQKAHAGKDRERKCQPGKGAERMREVGKEMQDRFKGYGHNRPHLVLSI